MPPKQNIVQQFQYTRSDMLQSHATTATETSARKQDEVRAIGHRRESEWVKSFCWTRKKQLPEREILLLKKTDNR